jgi:hypothetical protein
MLVGAGLLGLFALGVYLARAEVGPGEEPSVAPAVWSGDRVRVEVLNGGGVTGMARTATEVLRHSGFDVVFFGNAERFDPDQPSMVVDRVGRVDLAQAVAASLGIDNVQSDPDPNLFVDVTVVLGRSWVEPGLSGGDGSGGSYRARWDPRGWLGR